MAGYPLESLQTLRTGAKKSRTLDLAAAVAAAEEALAAVHAAEARRDQLRARLALARFDRGGPAAELARIDTHARALRARIAAEDGAIARARDAHERAEGLVAEARGDVAHARAEERAVERHRERWEEGERRRRDRAADE